jgi:hypothetical protein
LIIGDGIKEGAASITEFLTNSGHLNFAFGMIELTIFQINEFDKINDKIKVLIYSISGIIETEKIDNLATDYLLSLRNELKEVKESISRVTGV